MNSIKMAGPWITNHEIETVNDCMLHGWDNYRYVETFQKEFAKYHNRKYGIMTPNCTTAIHLLLAGLGIKDEDEVIVPDCTWIATAAPITYQRAKPVFCDIDVQNWCSSPESVEKCISAKTKAIITVDLFGNMPDMDSMISLSEKYGIPFIEDAAEAVGSIYKGIRAGKFGIGSVFSFHRTKTITTGEGGMLLLDDDKLYERCMFLRDHGRRHDGPMYFNFEVTFKYMPFNLQAAIGYSQFQRIDELVGKKQWILHKYKEHLADIPDIQMNCESESITNGAWITGLVFGYSHNISKFIVMEKMKGFGYPARPFFYPLSSLPAYPGYRKLYEKKNPNSYNISPRGINLPGDLMLNEEQIVEYCNVLKKVLEK